MVEAWQRIAFGEPRLANEEDAAACDDPFAALVRRQARFVFRVAYSILRNTHDAEDVVQETFLRLYRARKWEDMANERAFLARMAWRIAVDRLPKRRMDEPDTELPSGEDNPEQAVIATDWNATIHRMMDALPEKLRQPLALSAVEGLSSHEIAGLMGIREGTVRTRLMRARQILKEKLAALYGESRQAGRDD
jgi:RNA polymerase sigma-70 factor (ECF subfamily)